MTEVELITAPTTKRFFKILGVSLISLLVWLGCSYFIIQQLAEMFLSMKHDGTLSANWYPVVASYGAQLFLILIGILSWMMVFSDWKNRGEWSWDHTVIMFLMGGIVPIILLLLGYKKFTPPWNDFFVLFSFAYPGVPAFVLSTVILVKDSKLKVIRGTEVIESGKAETMFSKLLTRDLEEAAQVGFNDREGIAFWGTHAIPFSRENQHLLIAGSPGSGKTQVLYPIIEQTYARGDKAVIWDVKGNFTQAFYGRERVQLLAPWDKRSIHWRLGADVWTLEDCHQVASMLIPDHMGEVQPYFTNACRDVLEAILIHLHSSNIEWGWKDLCDIIQSGIEQLEATLSCSNYGKSVAEAYFHSRSGPDVYATLRSKTSIVYWLSKAWGNGGISLREWIKNEEAQTLILGGLPERERFASEIATISLQLLVKQLLSLPDNLSRRVWFYLDEIASLGKMNIITDLGTMGRSKGGCLVVGLQDIGRIEHLYGQSLSKSLANVFSTMIFLRCTDSATSQWASEVIGNREVLENQKSTSEGTQSRSGLLNASSGFSNTESVQEAIREKKTFIPSQIAQFSDMEGIFRSSSWPIAHLVWPRTQILQLAPLVEEASWVLEKEVINTEPQKKETKAYKEEEWGHLR